MSERGIQDAFAVWLEKNQIPFIRSRMDKASTIAVGFPDFSCFRDGKVCFIEVKTARGALSKAQKAKIAELALAGNVVHVCRSVEQCVTAVESVMGVHVAPATVINWNDRMAPPDWYGGDVATHIDAIGGDGCKANTETLRRIHWQGHEAIVRILGDDPAGGYKLEFVRLAQPCDAGIPKLSEFGR